MTLIELMIVVSVIAVLGAIAIPSYQAYVSKARRADARGALTNAAQMLERFATENPTTGYSTATLGSSGVYPNKSENGHYNLSFAATPGVSTYTLRAIPVAGPKEQLPGRIPVRKLQALPAPMSHLIEGWREAQPMTRELWRVLAQELGSTALDVAWFACDGQRDIGAVARLLSDEGHVVDPDRLEQWFDLTAQLGLSDWIVQA